jgi:hypothetical protein
MYDPAKFKQSTKVRIEDRSALENFRATWKLHHPLQIEQLEYAGHVAEIDKSYMHHGGDVLYELKNVPGLWHERCLSNFPKA